VDPRLFAAKAVIVSSTFTPCHGLAYPTTTLEAMHAPGSLCAMVPVRDWPEPQEHGEQPHLPHEERIRVDSGASGSFTNTSARTTSYTYTQIPFLRNLLGDDFITAVTENAQLEAEPSIPRMNLGMGRLGAESYSTKPLVRPVTSYMRPRSNCRCK
jgi:hypothetical protein